MTTPSIGRIVHYTLKRSDADAINQRRIDAMKNMTYHRQEATGVMVHVGNVVSQGDSYPMIITKVWGVTGQMLVNGTVFLDGSDTFWATSVGYGQETGMWMWPDLGTAPGQVAMS